MPICSQVFSEHGKRDIYFFSFLSLHTILDFQYSPFMLEK